LNPLDSFLRDHAFVHTAAVAPAFPANIDWLLDLPEERFRVLPHGFNSYAWILWHLARTEDACVSFLVTGRTQLLDEDDWAERLGVARRDLGGGMTKAMVGELSTTVRIPELLAYRNAVGSRTRTMVPSLWPDRCDTRIDPADIDRAADAEVFDRTAAAAMRSYLPSQTREAALGWWGLHHSLVHLGQLMMLHPTLQGTDVVG
jgi:hypothetical protein